MPLCTSGTHAFTAYLCAYALYLSSVHSHTVAPCSKLATPLPSSSSSTVRYSHLACEILTSETKETFTILDQLCSDDRYQSMLWAFLEQEGPLNPLIGSFISKVLSVLLAHKCSHVRRWMWDVHMRVCGGWMSEGVGVGVQLLSGVCIRAFLSLLFHIIALHMCVFPLSPSSPWRTQVVQYILSKESFLPSFLTHLNTSAFSDLLLQMFAAPDTDQARLDLALVSLRVYSERVLLSVFVCLCVHACVVCINSVCLSVHTPLVQWNLSIMVTWAKMVLT